MLCACRVLNAVTPVCTVDVIVLPVQGKQSTARGGPFAVLNGATASEAVVVAVPAGVQLERPLHLLYLSAGASDILLCSP